MGRLLRQCCDKKIQISMLTYKFFTDPRRGDTLNLRITNNRKDLKIGLGLKMTKEDLEDALSPKPSPKNAARSRFLLNLRRQLEEIKIYLIESGRRNEDIAVIKQIIKDKIFGEESSPASGEVVEWFTRFANTHPEGSRTRKVYEHTLNKLRAFCPTFGSLNFKDLTVSWLDEFDRHLSQTCRLNTRNHHMRNIRAVIKYAIRNDLDIRNPFDRMRLKTERTHHRALTIDDIRQLFTVDVEPYAEIYRDMFKLSFMLIGINSIDLFRLKEIRHGRIEYRRAKTHKPYSVKVEPEAMEIIKRYSGDATLLSLADRWKHHESFADGANKALRNIGAPRTAPGRSKAGKGMFPDLTLYWARHTWATIAASLDIPRDTIAHALGHGGNTVTDIYIDFDQAKVDQANRRVLDWVLYGKK